MNNPLSGPLVTLGPLGAEHFDTMYGWLTSWEVMSSVQAAAAWPPPRDLARGWIEARPPGRYGFSVTTASGAFVGTVALKGVDHRARAAALALIVDPQEQGRGYGTEATRLVTAFGFDELNLHRIELTVFEFNQAALAVYRRVGFTEEVRARDFVWRGGRWWDFLTMAMLEDEWRRSTS